MLMEVFDDVQRAGRQEMEGFGRADRTHTLACVLLSGLEGGLSGYIFWGGGGCAKMRPILFRCEEVSPSRLKKVQQERGRTFIIFVYFQLDSEQDYAALL